MTAPHSLASDEIFISDGAKSDCGNIGDIFATDNVIAVCDPVYPVYVDSNAMAGRAGDYVPHIVQALPAAHESPRHHGVAAAGPRETGR